MSKMRDMFLGYYLPDQDEFDALWKDALFVLDTNVLLNLYMYSIETREIWTQILTMLKERIWLPYYVVYEFQKNRILKISQQQKAFDNLKSTIEKKMGKLANELRSACRDHPIIEIENYASRISQLCEELVSDLVKESETLPDFYKKTQQENNDPIREVIEGIIEDRICNEYEKQVLDGHLKAGKERYKNKIPPGYKDNHKSSEVNRYGDLLIWFQIIDLAIENGRPVIFVTGDRKEDWWSKNPITDEIVGPHPELLQEFYEKTKKRCYFYNAKRFLYFAGAHLGFALPEAAVEETGYINALQQQNELLNYVAQYEQHGITDTKIRYHDIASDWFRKWFKQKYGYSASVDQNTNRLLLNGKVVEFTTLVTSESYGHRFLNNFPVDEDHIRKQLVKKNLELDKFIMIIVFRNDAEFSSHRQSLINIVREYNNHIIGGVISEDGNENFLVLFESENI